MANPSNRGEVVVEEGLDGRHYVYKRVDVKDDPDTTEDFRYDEVGSYERVEDADKAADRARNK